MSDMVGKSAEYFSMEHELENLEKQRLNLSETVEYMMLKYDALFHKNESEDRKRDRKGLQDPRKP